MMYLVYKTNVIVKQVETRWISILSALLLAVEERDRVATTEGEPPGN